VMIETASTTRSSATIVRAVRSGRLSRRLLGKINERRRALQMEEVAVADPLAEARDRAAAAVVRMKSLVGLA